MKTQEEFYDAFEKRELYMGRMISGSKSGYSRKYPDHLVLFNANIFSEDGNKVWFGDLDLTLDSKKLIDIHLELDVNLYVLREMDGRFDNEKNPNFKKDAIWNAEDGLSEKQCEYYGKTTLRLIKI